VSRAPLNIREALTLLEDKRRCAGPEQRLAHLRWMILARVLDERTLALYKSGELTGNAFLGKGQEALSAAIGMQLRRPQPGAVGDLFAPLIRDLAGRLAFGELPIDVTRTHLMKRTGPMRARDGNVHRGDLAKGMLPMISHLGAMVAPVVGVLLARRLRGALVPGDSCVGVASIGDGGTATGAFHEALNAVAIEKLPFVIVIANNHYSYSTCNDRSFACRDLVDRALGYGLHGSSCDGTDAEDCLAVVGGAIARARRGEGPQLVVATLLRLTGHGSHDDASYVTAELKARYGDCLELAQARVLADGLADQATLTRWWDEARDQVNAAVDQTRGEADPDPEEEDWCAYSERDLSAATKPPADGAQP
jgi:pyruvate dehydrogenase E1 component alpha subunit/2-oxoisovalerate dehydrogenase E1 component alpha subunit